MKLPPLWSAGTVPRSNALLEDLTYRDLCQTRCPDSRIPIGNVDKLVSVAGLGEKRRFSRRRLLCGQGQVGAAHQMDRLADVAPALRSASPALVRECWRTESLHRNSSRLYREVENPSINRPRISCSLRVSAASSTVWSAMSSRHQEVLARSDTHRADIVNDAPYTIRS